MMDDYIKPIDSKYSLDYRSFNKLYDPIPIPFSITIDNQNLNKNSDQYDYKYSLFIKIEPFVKNNFFDLDEMVEIMENYKLDALTTCSLDINKCIYLTGKVILGKIHGSFTLRAMINITNEQLMLIIEKSPVLIRSDTKIITTIGFIVWHNK